MNKDLKIQISLGCANFLTEEVEQLRRKNEILSAEKRIVDNFFNMINRLGDRPSQGYGEDLLWQAKREIASAVQSAEAHNDSCGEG